MARTLTSRIRITYEALESFNAVVRPREIAEWEQANMMQKIVRMARGVEFPPRKSVADLPWGSGEDSPERAKIRSRLARRAREAGLNKPGDDT